MQWSDIITNHIYNIFFLVIFQFVGLRPADLKSKCKVHHHRDIELQPFCIFLEMYQGLVTKHKVRINNP